VPYFGNQGDLVAGKFVELDFKVPMAGRRRGGHGAGVRRGAEGVRLAETVNAGVSVVYAPTTPRWARTRRATIYFNRTGACTRSPSMRWAT
jgi:hypothetical protein